MKIKTLIGLLSTPRAFGLALFIVGAIALLQYHGVQFWKENGAGLTAIAFTGLLELGALLAWSSTVEWHRWTLGLAATVFLLAGPLYVVSKDIVTEWQADDKGSVATELKREALEQEIASLQGALETYLANAKLAAIGALIPTEGKKRSKPVDWAAKADKTQTSLGQLNAELRAVITASATPAKRTDWQAKGIVGMQVVTLIVLQLMVVTFITELRHRAAANEEQPVDRSRAAAPAIAAAAPVVEPAAPHHDQTAIAGEVVTGGAGTALAALDTAPDAPTVPEPGESTHAAPEPEPVVEFMPPRRRAPWLHRMRG